MINAQKLTRAALANTFQEDADALSMCYNGWYNGLDKKSSFNYPRAGAAEHAVIVYCEDHQDKTIIQAIASTIDQEKKGIPPKLAKRFARHSATIPARLPGSAIRNCRRAISERTRGGESVRQPCVERGNADR